MDEQIRLAPDVAARFPQVARRPDRSAVGSPLSRAVAAAVDVLALTKPRIIVLLLITAFCAMVVADRGVPGVGVTVLTLLGLGLSAGGANAINMWYDRDIDAIMARTKARPVPSGRMAAGWALTAGIAMQAVSFPLLWVGVGWLPAVLALGGFIYYVFIYTMGLKRRTPQNIVIGGGAGAFPPLVGWSAVTGHIGIAALLMFLVIFLWTPPHFWSLALYREGDYRKANVPMMPVVRGERSTKVQSLIYAVVLGVASVLLYATGRVGLVYLVVAVVLAIGFVWILGRSLRERLPETRWAKRTFRYSLLYLTALFAVMVLNVRP